MTNEQFGRDAPIIGAGTYADNESCAVSATGHGEYFIRWTVAYDIAVLMKYGDERHRGVARASSMGHDGSQTKAGRSPPTPTLRT